MGKRRTAREFALQILYRLDMGQENLAEKILEEFWETNLTSDDVKEYTDLLVKGTKENQREIDRIIADSAENWTIDRMASVDRNILRFSTYEILKRNEIPSSVIINEAIEIAKKYGTEESGSFINGILDRVAKEVRKG
ncbi:MAG: transcription antitermination factor NusB [Nitrospirota bacterium]